MERELHALTAYIDVDWPWANVVAVTMTPFLLGEYLIVIVEAFNDGQLVTQFVNAVDEAKTMINKIRQAQSLFDNEVYAKNEREQMVTQLLTDNAATLADTAEQALAQAILAND